MRSIHLSILFLLVSSFSCQEKYLIYNFKSYDFKEISSETDVRFNKKVIGKMKALHLVDSKKFCYGTLEIEKSFKISSDMKFILKESLISSPQIEISLSKIKKTILLNNIKDTIILYSSSSVPSAN